MSNISSTARTQNRNPLRHLFNAFQNLKVGQKIIFGSAVALAILATITALVLINLNELTADFNFLVEHDQPVLTNAKDLEKLTVDMETGLRGFIITGQDEFLEPYIAGQAAFDQLLEEEKVLVSDNPPQVARLDEILLLHEEWISQAAEPEIAKRREVNQASVTSETLQETLRGGVGKGILDELRGVLDEMEASFRAADNLPAAILSVQIGKDMVDQETGQRGFIITGEESFLEPYNAGQEALDDHIAELRALLRDDPANSNRLDRVESLANDWVEQAAVPEIQARRDVDANPATIADVSAIVESGVGKNLLDQMRDKFAEFTAIEVELNEQRAADASRQNLVTFLLGTGLTIFGVVITLVLGTFISRNIVGPVHRLGAVASQISAGDLEARATVESSDEIGELASNFNAMTAQLSQTLGNLDARSVQLALAAEVGRSVSQVRALDVMLRDASELILKEFDLYYVQVYLTDPSQRNLILEAGTGEVGEQLLARAHKLNLDAGSLNGRAAVEKRSIVITDTAKSSAFRKNPLLPETRSEMAVPLIAGDRVVGVLDMQSSEPGALNEEVLSAFEALSGQLAVAIQNAKLLAEAEQARAEVEVQAGRLVRQGWNEHLDAIHKPENIGFVFDHNQVTALAEVDEAQLPDEGQSIMASISITGESLGSLSVEISDESQREQTNELVAVVARQVAQQIENLRLLESADRYRFQAEQSARLQTVDGWKKYMSSRAGNDLGYMYDMREVLPYKNGHDEDKSMFAVPIKVRDEKIGNLSIKGLTKDNLEEIELANVIVSRLSEHIESLRLFEETKQGQVELNKRAAELQSVAEISTQSSQATTVDELLQTVVDLTKSSYDLYHAHIYLLDDAKKTLTLAHGAGEIGSKMVSEELTIDIDHPHSLVARTARTGQGAISNDVSKEPDFLPHPLLPETKAEMAVPIKLGDRVLGVLDVQADITNRFTDDDIAIKSTLAQQVGASLDNMRQHQISQKIARELGVVANVSTATATITDATHLLQEVVDLTKEAFSLYHVHIYLMNSTGDALELAAGAGEVGRQMVAEGREIPMTSEKSLVVRAARTRSGAVANDVMADPDFLPNPLLPDTRSEQAVPMIVGDKVIGVLDVQAVELNRFTEIDINIKTTLAAQIAVALQNALTFTQAQSQAKREAMLNTINQKIQNATSVEAVLQIAARELGHALGAPMAVAQLSMRDKS